MKLPLLILLAGLPVCAEWRVLNSGISEDLLAVHFPTPDTGFVCGRNGTLLRTINKGENWSPLDFGAGKRDLYSIHFMDSRNGVVTGDTGFVAYSLDGGQSWNRSESKLESNLGTLSLNGTVLFGGGWDGSIFYSMDQGVLWKSTTIDFDTVPKSKINSLHFPNTFVGFATCGLGILKTTDQGLSWYLVKNYRDKDYPNATILTTCFFTTSESGFFAGPYYGVITGTKDGAKTLKKATSYSINSLFFTSTMIGYAAGIGSQIYQTLDGGENWASQRVLDLDAPSLLSLHFIDGELGFAVGERGAILRYNGSSSSNLSKGSVKQGWKKALGPESSTTLDSQGRTLTGKPSAEGRYFHP